MWFFWGGHDPNNDWEALCEAAVAKAMEHGAQLPDTQLAAARMHTQRGRYADAARALQHALRLAPTHAAAHSYLGTLQCEAGRTKEGLRHIALALELEPTDLSPLLTSARHSLLHGDEATFEAHLARIQEGDGEIRYPVLITRLRVGMWRRDLDEVRRWRDAIANEGRQGVPYPMELGSYVLGEVDEERLLEVLDLNVPRDASPRYRALMEQLTVEGMIARGEEARGLRLLEELGRDVLVDVDWIERCPLLVPLHDREELRRVRARVRERAQAIWSVS